jgi:hypothetical protein
MSGPPDRFELSVFERLRPVIMAIDKRALQAEERRQAIAGDLRGLTPEESAHLEAGWAKVRDADQAAQQHLLDALECLNDAAQALYAPRALSP